MHQKRNLVEVFACMNTTKLNMPKDLWYNSDVFIIFLPYFSSEGSVTEMNMCSYGIIQTHNS